MPLLQRDEGELMEIQAIGEFGMYKAPAERVARVQRQYRNWADEEVKTWVEERAGHEAPWPRSVHEIMLAEWETE